MAAICSCRQCRISSCLLNVLTLHRCWAHMPLTRGGLFLGGRSYSGAACATVVTDLADIDVVDDSLVVRVMHNGCIYVRHGLVVGEGAARPTAADKANTAV